MSWAISRLASCILLLPRHLAACVSLASGHSLGCCRVFAGWGGHRGCPWGRGVFASPESTDLLEVICLLITKFRDASLCYTQLGGLQCCREKSRTSMAHAQQFGWCLGLSQPQVQTPTARSIIGRAPMVQEDGVFGWYGNDKTLQLFGVTQCWSRIGWPPVASQTATLCVDGDEKNTRAKRERPRKKASSPLGRWPRGRYDWKIASCPCPNPLLRPQPVSSNVRRCCELPTAAFRR